MSHFFPVSEHLVAAVTIWPPFEEMLMNLGQPSICARISTNSPATLKLTLQATNLFARDRRAIFKYLANWQSGPTIAVTGHHGIALSRQCADLLIIPFGPLVQRNGQSRYSGLELDLLAYGMAIVQQLSRRAMPQGPGHLEDFFIGKAR